MKTLTYPAGAVVVGRYGAAVSRGSLLVVLDSHPLEVEYPVWRRTDGLMISHGRAWWGWRAALPRWGGSFRDRVSGRTVQSHTGVWVAMPWLALPPGLVWVVLWRRRIGLVRRGGCLGCGYDLRGLPLAGGGVCPECGGVYAEAGSGRGRRGGGRAGVREA